jgi:hypothetical protein
VSVRLPPSDTLPPEADPALRQVLLYLGSGLTRRGRGSERDSGANTPSGDCVRSPGRRRVSAPDLRHGLPRARAAGRGRVDAATARTAPARPGRGPLRAAQEGRTRRGPACGRRSPGAGDRLHEPALRSARDHSRTRRPDGRHLPRAPADVGRSRARSPVRSARRRPQARRWALDEHPDDHARDRGLRRLVDHPGPRRPGLGERRPAGDDSAARHVSSRCRADDVGGRALGR